MTIYELTGASLQLYEMFDEPDVDADAVLDTFEALMPDIKEKLVAYMLVVKNKQAEADAIAEELKKLRDRKTAQDNAVERMKQRMLDLMNASGLTKVEDPKGVISIRKPSKVVAIGDGFIEWAKAERDDLLRYKEPEIDKTAIARELKAGKEIRFAALVDGKQNITLK